MEAPTKRERPRILGKERKGTVFEDGWVCALFRTTSPSFAGTPRAGIVRQSVQPAVAWQSFKAANMKGSPVRGQTQVVSVPNAAGVPLVPYP